jgi:hypothetical protein
MYLLKCLYHVRKVRRHVFVKVPVPSHESEMFVAWYRHFNKYMMSHIPDVVEAL